MGAVHAQNESDAIRYSSGYWYGTARSMGVGGAVSTLGADASAITLNPAGLAQYRSSEFSSSLSFQNISNRASYINSVTRDARFNMNIPNLSLIIADQQYDGNKPRTEGWVNYAVGFGVNRSHDFHSRTFFRDTNNSSSVTDYFADRANGTLVDDMQEGSLERIAWDAYAMDAGSTNGTYLSPLLGGTRMLRQSVQQPPIGPSGGEGFLPSQTFLLPRLQRSQVRAGEEAPSPMKRLRPLFRHPPCCQSVIERALP